MGKMSNIFYVNPLGQMNLSELESLFTLIGDVKSIRSEILLQSKVGTRFGVIEMETDQQAADCIERFNGQDILGQVRSVTSALPILKIAPVEARKAKCRKHETS